MSTDDNSFHLLQGFWLVGCGWLLTFSLEQQSRLGFAYYFATAFPGLPTNLVAARLCLGFTALNLVGAKESAGVNNVLVSIKLAVLAFFVVFGSLHFNSGNFVPFNPLTNGVLYGSFFIFFAYGGFARVTVVAEEVKDAKRNVPRALLLVIGYLNDCVRFGWHVAVGLLMPHALSVSSSPLSSAMSVTENPICSQHYLYWRFSGYRKRLVDSYFRGFKDGLFYGTSKRFTL